MIGGGVVQDISSFGCSIYLRGLKWNFYPTTLLAQADSCIGSKTSISNICKKLNLKIILLETNGLDVQTILSSSEKSINKFLVNKQLLIDELNLGDHYRVFLKSM